ncbi:hypothetical protein [Desulfovibrio sp.]|uniref:hypothetical protein n=1 Tax=Desulfovibrio sp. TaxID=885 RepID=UPI0025C14AEA|nr:hypothetical protein [Desulfovibrio sp.]
MLQASARQAYVILRIYNHKICTTLIPASGRAIWLCCFSCPDKLRVALVASWTTGMGESGHVGEHFWLVAVPANNATVATEHAAALSVIISPQKFNVVMRANNATMRRSKKQARQCLCVGCPHLLASTPPDISPESQPGAVVILPVFKK